MPGLSAAPMLTLDVSQIPPEGMDVDSPLEAGEVHLEGERSFDLQPGGSLRCHVERGDDQTIHVRGHLAARLGLECGRCLEPFPLAVDQHLDLFYLPHRDDAGEEDEVEVPDRDMVVAYYAGDRLDLGEMVREQLFLSIPMKRLCREACRGLCPQCGINRNAAACSCVEQEPDQRLAGLGKLLKGS
jgi:uncharacterized protein